MNTRNSPLIKVKGHIRMYCLPVSVVTHGLLYSLCISEAIDLSLVHLNSDKKKRHITCVGWNNCYCAQHTKALGWHFPQSICLRPMTKTLKCPPPSCVATKKLHILRSAAATSSFWNRSWMHKSTAFVSLSRQNSGCNYSEGHCFSLKGWFKCWNWDFRDDWLRCKAGRKLVGIWGRLSWSFH